MGHKRRPTWSKCEFMRNRMFEKHAVTRTSNGLVTHRTMTKIEFMHLKMQSIHNENHYERIGIELTMFFSQFQIFVTLHGTRSSITAEPAKFTFTHIFFFHYSHLIWWNIENKLTKWIRTFADFLLDFPHNKIHFKCITKFTFLFNRKTLFTFFDLLCNSHNLFLCLLNMIWADDKQWPTIYTCKQCFEKRLECSRRFCSLLPVVNKISIGFSW